MPRKKKEQPARRQRSGTGTKKTSPAPSNEAAREDELRTAAARARADAMNLAALRCEAEFAGDYHMQDAANLGLLTVLAMAHQLAAGGTGFPFRKRTGRKIPRRQLARLLLVTPDALFLDRVLRPNDVLLAADLLDQADEFYQPAAEGSARLLRMVVEMAQFEPPTGVMDNLVSLRIKGGTEPRGRAGRKSKKSI